MALFRTYTNSTLFKARMSDNGCEVLCPPENTVIKPLLVSIYLSRCCFNIMVNKVKTNSTLLQARHSFFVYNEQPGSSENTVILSESGSANKLDSEEGLALAEAPYKTPAPPYLNNGLDLEQVNFF